MELVNLPNWMPLVGLSDGNEVEGLTNMKELANLRIEGVFIPRFYVLKDDVPQKIGSISV